MLDVLRRVATDAGTACLLATHDELALASAGRVLELHEGRLQAVVCPSPPAG